MTTQDDEQGCGQYHTTIKWVKDEDEGEDGEMQQPNEYEGGNRQDTFRHERAGGRGWGQRERTWACMDGYAIGGLPRRRVRGTDCRGEGYAGNTSIEQK